MGETGVWGPCTSDVDERGDEGEEILRDYTASTVP